MQFTTPSQGAGMQAYLPSAGWRNDMALQGGWETHSSALGLQTQHNEFKKVKIKWPQLVGDKDIHRKHTKQLDLEFTLTKQTIFINIFRLVS
jgi:hypothetical protein